MTGCAAALLGVCLLASAGSVSSAEPVVARDSPWLLFQADLQLSDARRPPADESRWQPVELPDTWRLHDRYRQGVSAWYRFRMPDRPPDEPWSLYLWRFSMNAEAYFNEELIGSGGSFDEPITRNWNRPLLFPIPHSAWSDSANYLYVHLRIYPGFGNLTPPALGPTRLLEPAYEARFFYQITLSEWSFILTLTLAAVALAFWSIERRDSTYLFFAACALAWSIHCLNLFVQDIPVSAATWWWAVHASIDLFSASLVFLIHRLMRVSRPIFERVVAALTLVALALYALWDLPALARYNGYVHMVTTLFPTYLTFWVWWQAFKHRRPETIVLSLSLAVLVAFGTHDLVLNSLAVPELWMHRSYVTQFGAPAMLVVLVVHLGMRLAGALAETRSANVRLEARVSEATAALEQNYARRTVLEREQAAAAERERIYQDLHDDVGAKLLSLVYASRDERQAGIARDALREIRSIVSSDRLEGGELRDIVADWRIESETRCEQAGYRLEWEDRLEDAKLSGIQRYHLDRILRELVSNALEHSRGSVVRARVTCTGGRLSLTVEDDGRGLGTNESAASQGLNGIRRRVDDLGGSVHWERGNPAGVCCTVAVPVAAPNRVET